MSDEESWSIDDFARAGGTSVRNVRLYQERGLIPPPDRSTRPARYGPDHLRRLRLVLTLLKRGYPLAAIRELLEAWEDNRSLGAVLGFEEALAVPSTPEPPRRYTDDQLATLYPGAGERERARAVEAGLLVPDGDGFVAPVPTVLEVGAELVALGAPLDAVIDAWQEIEAASRTLAALFVRVFLETVWEPFAARGRPAEEWPALTAALNAQRRTWPRAVVATLAHALDAEIDETARRVAAEDLGAG
jgi:DNA-binding transcriptional MerR regulator